MRVSKEERKKIDNENERNRWYFYFFVLVMFFAVPLTFLFFSNKDAFSGGLFISIWIIVGLFVAAVRSHGCF